MPEYGYPIESTAAIVDGTIYVAVQSADLLAVDLRTGKLRWKDRTRKPRRIVAGVSRVHTLFVFGRQTKVFDDVYGDAISCWSWN